MLHRHSRGQRSEDAISEVVGFIVILAIIVASLSLYLTYALPVLGREGEIKEMDDVRAWFVDYKTGTDQLWLHSPLVPEDVDSDAALFNATVGQVTLRRVINTGTVKEKGFTERYFPLLAPIPSSASVSVREGESLEIRALGTNGIEYDTAIPAPALGYTSFNNYWFSQQYYYQLGGVFLRQWDQKGGVEAENVTLVAGPPLSIYNHADGSMKVELVAVNLGAEAGGIGSKSPVRVETRLDADPARPADQTGTTWPTGFSEVSLTFRGATPQAADEWRKVFTGASARNGGMDEAIRAGSTAWINITGADTTSTVNDVTLEVLLANYTMRLQNVPTMIE